MIMPVLLFMAPYLLLQFCIYGSDVYNVHLYFFPISFFEEKYMAAGIMAACSSGTRIVGCILVFALVVQYILTWKELR